MAEYNHKEIEEKWQKKWEDSGLYDVDARDVAKEKEYILVEWPYPSGNLHIGHWFAFAVVDIYARFKRMRGKQVVFPMGFDAFGLPAENAAIKNKLNPKEWTESNIAFMKKQLKSMGNAFSWDKTTSSTDPDYYKWTQWMFTKFFENDIAYRGTGIVNWCPSCNTVLANEQVTSEEMCERCGSEVEKKKMEEWKMRITKYADRLIDDLDKLDWPEHIKESQRQWIGRSSGAELAFKLSTGDDLHVFTTRPDTLFGATYMVVAPEHEILERHKKKIINWEEISTYIQMSQKRSDMERTNAQKEKTGVKLEGITATNPANNEEIPVFVADYVLSGYGTGAIMAVPAHDDRDFAFAAKYRIPIVQVLEGSEALPFARGESLVNSGEFNKMDSKEAQQAITEKVGGTMAKTYKLRDWSVGRQRYWGVPIPIVYDPEGKPHAISEEHLPWLLPEDVDPTPTGEPPLAKSKELKERTEKIFGKGWTPATETMDTFVDSSWYFLRYVDNKNHKEFSSKSAQKDWMPIDVYFGGAEHTTMHLLYSRFWQKALFDLDLVTEDEPYTRRINRGLVLGPDGNKMSKSKGNVIDPDEQVTRLGADTVKMYLAFMGPYGEVTNYPWDMGGIAGIRRFLERVWKFATIVEDQNVEELDRELHRTIQKVEGDIKALKFNTAISQMMIFANKVEEGGKISKQQFQAFLQILAPFAPHMTEELWGQLGNTSSIHEEKWPKYDKNKVLDEQVVIAIQVNGKIRGELEVDRDTPEEEIVTQVKKMENVERYLQEGKIVKQIYVKNRLLSFVIG